MSEENVEVVRRAWEAFLAALERGDPGALFDSGLLVEDFEWVSTAGGLARPRGVRGVHPYSGVPVDLHVGQVVEVKDGRQVRVTNYLSHAEALEAAGLRE